MHFRKNINALRAIAVLAVVLYHFGVPGFSGGFVGVDVFFVISGFLMTGIITTALQRNDFSLWAFYAARARRIIPALAALCIALLIFGFIFLPLSDYRDLIYGIKHSLLFDSNLRFAQSANYFSDSSQGNWLLHTWSLSVEWQFYLLYPLLLWLVAKTAGLSGLRWTVAALALGSLIASVIITRHDMTWAFYHLATRAWELMAGGLIWLFPVKVSTRLSRGLEALGLLLVASAIGVFDEQSPWPGHSAVWPVAGAMLIILANRDSRFSTHPGPQFLGRISYSVYLWHWPLVVGLYLAGLLKSPVAVALGIGCAVVLGTASYHLIERRKTSARPWRVLAVQAGQTAFLILIATGIGSLAKAHPAWRHSEPQRPAYLSAFYPQTCAPTETKAQDCQLGEGEIKVIILGDSHAQSTAAAVQLDNPGAALSWSYPGCPALAQFHMRDRGLQRDCLAYNRAKFSQLTTDYPGVPVVLFSRAGLYTDPDRENSHYVSFTGATDAQSNAQRYISEYADTVCQIAQHHPLYLVRPIPDMPLNVYKSLWFQQRLGRTPTDIRAPLERYTQRNAIALQAIDRAQAQCNAHVIDPTPILCPDGQCQGSQNGISLYWDDNHLVDAGNRLIAPLFKPLFPPPL